jgi:hypothetical protein
MEHIYSGMRTGNFLWKEQDILPLDGMLIPLICGPDKTLLTIMAENQGTLPVYLTVGNVQEAI